MNKASSQCEQVIKKETKERNKDSKNLSFINDKLSSTELWQTPIDELKQMAFTRSQYQLIQQIEKDNPKHKGGRKGVFKWVEIKLTLAATPAAYQEYVRASGINGEWKQELHSPEKIQEVGQVVGDDPEALKYWHEVVRVGIEDYGNRPRNLKQPLDFFKRTYGKQNGRSPQPSQEIVEAIEATQHKPEPEAIDPVLSIWHEVVDGASLAPGIKTTLKTQHSVISYADELLTVDCPHVPVANSRFKPHLAKSADTAYPGLKIQFVAKEQT